MLKRDFAAAEKTAPNIEDADTKEMCEALTAFARGDIELARRRFELLRSGVETLAHDHPDESRYPALLGLIYAYLGRKEDAIREGRRAVELERKGEDIFHGTGVTCNLALIYARTGEVDQAIELIERLLSLPGAADPESSSSITLTELRLRWEWDPLRNDPRFQKILAGPEPKTIY
jgi:Flp pilus assembly protein TadD